jgi:hypothetical protein
MNNQKNGVSRNLYKLKTHPVDVCKRVKGIKKKVEIKSPLLD